MKNERLGFDLLSKQNWVSQGYGWSVIPGIEHSLPM